MADAAQYPPQWWRLLIERILGRVIAVGASPSKGKTPIAIAPALASFDAPASTLRN